jgi:lysophospholipase L1-like esterase
MIAKFFIPFLLLLTNLYSQSIPVVNTPSFSYTDSVELLLPRFSNQLLLIKTQKVLPNDVLFVGSSSIRGWKFLEEDFAPIRVQNMGFGGATLYEVWKYAPEILFPHSPKALVVYAGENDLTIPYSSAEQVFNVFQLFYNAITTKWPELPVYFISVKPTPYSRIYWEKQQAFNSYVEQSLSKIPHWHFIDITKLMLNDQGEPNESLFLKDLLHMNREGYLRWRNLIKPLLEI